MAHKRLTKMELFCLEIDVLSLIAFDDVVTQFTAAKSRKCFRDVNNEGTNSNF